MPRFAEVKHNKKKVGWATTREVYRGGIRGRTVMVKVVISRSKYSGAGEFDARACMATGRSGGPRRGLARCSTLQHARSPTKAVKKALADLAKAV